MPRTSGRTSLLLIAGIASALALVACNGWPQGGEIKDAQSKPEKYPTYAAAQAEQPPFEFEGRHWMVSPSTEELIGARLEAVGSGGNVALYAQPGSQAPHAVLFAPAGGNRWHRVLPID